MTHAQTDTQIRLRRAKEALASAREAEATARKALHDAMQASARAKERHDELFLLEEREECQRRKREYRHATN